MGKFMMGTSVPKPSQLHGVAVEMAVANLAHWVAVDPHHVVDQFGQFGG